MMFYELLGPYCVNKSTWKINKRPKCQFPCHLFKQLCLKSEIFFENDFNYCYKVLYTSFTRMCWPHDYQQVFSLENLHQCSVRLCTCIYVMLCMSCLFAGDHFLVYSVLILLEYGVDVWSLFQLFSEKWQYERNSP